MLTGHAVHLFPLPYPSHLAAGPLLGLHDTALLDTHFVRHPLHHSAGAAAPAVQRI
jgi:hypothetical protein